jgi:hypothetical protein
LNDQEVERLAAVCGDVGDAALLRAPQSKDEKYIQVRRSRLVVPPTLITHGPANSWLSGERALVHFPQGEINATVTHTGCTEVRDEVNLFRVVLAVAFSDAIITSRKDDADALRTEPCERVAQCPLIFWRDLLLLVAIRYADCLRDVWRTEYVVEPLEVHVARAWLFVEQPLFLTL